MFITTHRHTLLSGLGLALLLAVTAPDPSAAKIIDRHCEAQYHWSIQALKPNINYPPHTDPTQVRGRFGKFTGRGKCGKRVPNSCRERASEAAMRCMRTHWDIRWERKKPELCYPASDVLDYGLGLPKYQVPAGDIKKRLEAEVCCSQPEERRGITDVVVHLEAKVYGDKGCPKVRSLESSYVIPSCSKVVSKHCP